MLEKPKFDNDKVIAVKSMQELTEIIKNNENKFIVMDFWAEWCNPCKAFRKIYERSFAKFKKDFIFLEINTEIIPEITSALDIAGIPLLIFFKNGREIYRRGGILSKSEFEGILSNLASGKSLI